MFLFSVFFFFLNEKKKKKAKQRSYDPLNSPPFFLQLNSEMWARPDKQGELRKEGHFVKNWKIRWFILQKDKLFYFKSRLDSKPVGYIPLKDSVVRRSDKFRGKREFVFELNAASIGKSFFIQATTQSDMESWMREIQSSSETDIVSSPFNVQHNIHVDFSSVCFFFF